MAGELQEFESNTPLEDGEDSDHTSDEGNANELQPSARQSIPLTNFENSIQNVCAVSFILGCFFATNLLMLISGSGGYAKLNIHLIVLVVFHMLEFLVTAICNHARVTISSFLLNNGYAYWICQLLSILEFLFTRYFSPPSRSRLLDVIGLTAVLLGQSIRTLSMITAAQSFNHQVSTHKIRRSDHVLITEGVYSILRHPAYFGFFWWTVGLQCFLRNSLCLVLFAVILWRFFNLRIQTEERHLVKFFGTPYVDYKSRTGVHIPFIK